VSTHALSTLLDVPFIARRIRALASAEGDGFGEIIEKNAEQTIERLIHFTGVVTLADDAGAGAFRSFDDRPAAPPAIFARPFARAEAIRAEVMSGLASSLRGAHAAPAERALHAHLVGAGIFDGASKAARAKAVHDIAPDYLRPFRHYVPRARRALRWLRADLGDDLRRLGGAAERGELFDRLFERAVEPHREELYDRCGRALEIAFERGLLRALEAEPKGYVPLDLSRLYEVGGFVHDFLRLVSDLGVGLVDREIDVVRALVFAIHRPPAAEESP
jgi:hypothetical protein